MNDSKKLNRIGALSIILLPVESLIEGLLLNKGPYLIIPAIILILNIFILYYTYDKKNLTKETHTAYKMNEYAIAGGFFYYFMLYLIVSIGRGISDWHAT